LLKLFHRSKSEQFRSLLRKLDSPYETKWDNEGYDDLPEVAKVEDTEAEEEQSDFEPNSIVDVE